MFPVTERRKAEETEEEEQLYVRWDQLKEVGAEWRVRWTPLKPKRRALHKVLFRYEGERRRLLDVCREAMAFETLPELHACLGALIADREVEVTRIKNSLSPTGHSELGFRAVVVNLRFVSGPAQCLGLQCHTCELILMLLSFAHCLTEEEHTDYLNSRIAEVAPPLPMGTIQTAPQRPSVSSTRTSWTSQKPPRPSDTSLGQGSPRTVHPDSLVSPPGRPATSPIPMIRLDRASSPVPPPSSHNPPPRALTSEAAATSDPNAVPRPSPPPSPALNPSHRPRPLSKPPPAQLNPSSLQLLPLSQRPGAASPDRQRLASESSAAESEVAPAEGSLVSSHRESRVQLLPLRALRRGQSQNLSSANLNLWPSFDVSALLSDEWPAELGPEEGLGLPVSGCRVSSGVPACVLLEQYKVRTMRQGGKELFDWRPTLRDSVDHCSTFSIFSTSFPIAAAMRKRVFFPIFVLITGLSVWNLVPWPGLLYYTETARWMRVEALQLREPGAALAGPVVDTVKARLRGCELWADDVVQRDELTTDLYFAEGGTFDEVVLVTSREQDARVDPVVFRVQVSEDAEEWTTVAASRKVVERDGAVRFEETAVDVPEERGAEVGVNLTSRWMLGDFKTLALTGLCFFILTLCSATRKYELGAPMVVLALTLLGLGYLLDWVSGLVTGLYASFPVSPLLRGLHCLGAAYWLHYVKEQHVVEMVAQISALTIATTLLNDLVLDPDAKRLVEKPPFGALFMLILCIFLLGLKRRTHSRAFRRIVADIEEYSHAWDRIYANPAQRQGCARIAAALAAVKSKRRRQMYQLLEPLASSPVSAWQSLNWQWPSSFLADHQPNLRHPHRADLRTESSSSTALPALLHLRTASASSDHARGAGSSGPSLLSRVSSLFTTRAPRHPPASAGSTRAPSSPSARRGARLGPQAQGPQGRTASLRSGEGLRAGARRQSNFSMGSQDSGEEVEEEEEEAEGACCACCGASPPRLRSSAVGGKHTCEQPVKTLGLLYRQAAGTYCLAKLKLQQWANHDLCPSGAMLPGKQRGSDMKLFQLREALRAQEGGDGSAGNGEHDKGENGTVGDRGPSHVATAEGASGGIAGVTRDAVTAVPRLPGDVPVEAITAEAVFPTSVAAPAKIGASKAEVLRPPPCATPPPASSALEMSSGEPPILKAVQRRSIEIEEVDLKIVAAAGLGAGSGRPPTKPGAQAGEKGASTDGAQAGLSRGEEVTEMSESHGAATASLGERVGSADEGNLWPALKGLQRAAQKLMRTYAADVSKLIDVCRFGVVFHDTSALADFLDVLLADPDVRVVSFKNRLRDDYDARLSGGYRDLHLNLVMRSREARRLGLHHHVWELQLLLRPLAALRSDGGHKRYVEYRDARGQ